MLCPFRTFQFKWNRDFGVPRECIRVDRQWNICRVTLQKFTAQIPTGSIVTWPHLPIEYEAVWKCTDCMTKTKIARPLVWNRTRRRHITYKSVNWHCDTFCLCCKYSISLSPFTMNVTSNRFVCYSEGVGLKCYFGVVSIGEWTCLAAWYIAFPRKNLLCCCSAFLCLLRVKEFPCAYPSVWIDTGQTP
jgi:hypothetical protein